MVKLDGAVCVVTGGASGIGEACVRMAAAGGARVSIWDLAAQRGRAERLIAEIGAPRALFCAVNVASEEDVDAAVAATVARFGRIDCCVNSAGVSRAAATVSRKHAPHPMKLWALQVQVNLIGSFLCASRCAAQMSKQPASPDGERGVVVNIASIAAFDGQNGQTAYAASKAGVVGMTLPMSRDLGRFGIRVNTVCPGIVDTPMGGGPGTHITDRDPAKMQSPVQRSLLTNQTFPTRRFARPDEMASLVKFMIETVFMNGEHVRLDAGNRMPKL